MTSCKRTKRKYELDTKSQTINIPQDPWINKRINVFPSTGNIPLANFVNQLGKPRIKVIYYFNGECSSCIRNLIDWYKYFTESKTENEDINCLYLSFGADDDVLQFYLEKLNIELENQLFHDINNEFRTANSFLSSNKEYSTYIFLLDENNRIIAFGNPFMSENVKSIYKKSGVIN